MKRCFNPAEAEEWFRRAMYKLLPTFLTAVSIQPKPKNGLEAACYYFIDLFNNSFNPAEAEEWFRSFKFLNNRKSWDCFNPAEAEEWFRSM